MSTTDLVQRLDTAAHRALAHAFVGNDPFLGRLALALTYLAERLRPEDPYTLR